MKKNFVVISIVLAFVALISGAYYFVKSRTLSEKINIISDNEQNNITAVPQPSENPFAPVPNVEEQSDMIRVTSMEPNDEISDSVMVDGQARSWWFSEDGQFTVSVVDAQGITIGQFSALALEKFDPNKDEMVPFRVSLVFERPQSDTGFLFLERWGWEEIVGGWKNMLVFPVQFGD